MTRFFAAIVACLLSTTTATPNPPVASYIFPAGGQRGTTVKFKVGGLFLHESCGFAMLGPGVKASPTLTSVSTLWLEGPILPLPDSQRQEDYPKDMSGSVTIAADAVPGFRWGRLWTSQGAASGLKFQVGELPEIVEEELDGDAVPVLVEPPVTINGRIFPREDVDLWSIRARKGQTYSCEVHANRVGSPLDARLEILANGRVLGENEPSQAIDPRLVFTAPADGVYQVRIRDSQFQGGQAYVYRLTITQGSAVDRVFPLGARRGAAVTLDVGGTPVAVKVPPTAKESWLAEFSLAGKAGRVLLDVDELPEVLEGADVVKGPAILNGRIGQPGEIDAWTIEATKGQPLELALRAGVLGSPLDGIVTIADETGKTLQRIEGEKPATFAAPADGRYTLTVQDRFRSRGGPAFAYRLRVAPPSEPDFRLTLPSDAVTVPRKGQAKLKLGVERLSGFKEPISIRAEGLPDGVKLAPATVKPGQATVDLAFLADAAAPIDVKNVSIVGEAANKDRKWQQRASLSVARGQAPIDELIVAVALPTPFVIKGEYDMGFAARGTMHRRKYKIERNGYEGPIEVSLADRQARHLQGVTGPKIVVPAKQNEFTYEAYLPPWMETGRTCRVCVMGVGTVREGDRDHRVSFSSVNQNEQLVAVVGPGELALELSRSSGTAIPGGRLEIPLSVKRGLNVRGEVKIELELPRHLRGVTAEPLRLAGDADEGVLSVRFGDRLVGHFSMPLVVRATLLQEGRPIVAEALLDVQPEER